VIEPPFSDQGARLTTLFWRQSFNKGGIVVLGVEDNPLKNIELLANPEKNLKLIMKDGKIYKNTL